MTTQIEVGGGQHYVLYAVDGAERFPGCMRFDVQLAQGTGQDIRPPTMGDEVELLQFRCRGQQPQKLLQVKDGELSRFAVVVIAAQPFRPRPARYRGSAPLTAQEMPEFGDHQHAILRCCYTREYRHRLPCATSATGADGGPGAPAPRRARIPPGLPGPPWAGRCARRRASG